MENILLQPKDLIKQRRETLGLTQKEFACLLNLKESGDRTISGWERGEHAPTDAKLKIIERKKNFLRFSKGWISKNDVKPIFYKEKNPFRKISIFCLLYNLTSFIRLFIPFSCIFNVYYINYLKSPLIHFYPFFKFLSNSFLPPET